MAREDGGRCRRQRRDDGLVMWPGSDTRPRDWSKVLVKKLAVEEASPHLYKVILLCWVFAWNAAVADLRNNSLLPHLMEGHLELQKWMGLHFYQECIFTILCLDFTLYCAPATCSSNRYRLIKGK
ncbi:hypothetical protein BU17DRAFT_60092 [Hysterangium stoloniferum]|nr:hypothetical protein BU17DRAFT_60092 [Hysterangium stoloniferum]